MSYSVSRMNDPESIAVEVHKLARRIVSRTASAEEILRFQELIAIQGSLGPAISPPNADALLSPPEPPAYRAREVA